MSPPEVCVQVLPVVDALVVPTVSVYVVPDFTNVFNDDIKGRVGGDTVITHDKSKTQIIGGQYTMSVTGKEMDSNPKAAGIFITTDSNYMLNVSSDLSQSTISGIVSIKSGSTLNMKSVDTMSYATEANLVGTTTTTWDHQSGGDISIQGGPNINLNPPAEDD